MMVIWKRVEQPNPPRTYNAVDPAVRIGHVHLKVANLARALEFYNGVLGFEIMQRLGESAIFYRPEGIITIKR